MGKSVFRLGFYPRKVATAQPAIERLSRQGLTAMVFGKSKLGSFAQRIGSFDEGMASHSHADGCVNAGRLILFYPQVDDTAMGNKVHAVAIKPDHAVARFTWR